MSTEFSLELRVSRKKSGLTQSDVAHLLGVKQSLVSGFEKGRRVPPVRELVKLSLIYGRSFDCLYAELVRDARQELLARLETLPEEVRRCAGTFNRSSTIERLRLRLVTEIDEYDSAA